MPRKTRGRIKIVVPLEPTGSYTIETLPTVNLSAKQVVEELRKRADDIERWIVAKEKGVI